LANCLDGLRKITNEKIAGFRAEHRARDFQNTTAGC
jgi:hypothetical protein